MERFIKEYASFRKKQIEENTLAKEPYRTEAIKRINGTLTARERRLITVNEAINNILNCFD